MLSPSPLPTSYKIMYFTFHTGKEGSWTTPMFVGVWKQGHKYNDGQNVNFSTKYQCLEKLKMHLLFDQNFTPGQTSYRYNLT